MGDRLKAGWIKKQSPKQELWFKWFIIDYSFAAITSNSENLNFGGQGGSMSRQFIKHSMKFHRIPFHETFQAIYKTFLVNQKKYIVLRIT